MSCHSCIMLPCAISCIAVQEKNSLVLDNATLEKIWFVLRQHIGLSNEAPKDSLNYDEFCQARPHLLSTRCTLICQPPLCVPPP